MANDGAFGDFPPLRGEPNMPVVLDGHKSILGQALQSERYGWPRYGKPMCQRGRNNSLAFRFRFRDGLQIVLFGNRNHRCHSVTSISACSLTLVTVHVRASTGRVVGYTDLIQSLCGALLTSAHPSLLLAENRESG